MYFLKLQFWNYFPFYAIFFTVIWLQSWNKFPLFAIYFYLWKYLWDCNFGINIPNFCNLSLFIRVQCGVSFHVLQISFYLWKYLWDCNFGINIPNFCNLSLFIRVQCGVSFHFLQFSFNLWKYLWDCNFGINIPIFATYLYLLECNVGCLSTFCKFLSIYESIFEVANLESLFQILCNLSLFIRLQCGVVVFSMFCKSLSNYEIASWSFFHFLKFLYIGCSGCPRTLFWRASLKAATSKKIYKIPRNLNLFGLYILYILYNFLYIGKNKKPNKKL